MSALMEMFTATPQFGPHEVRHMDAVVKEDEKKARHVLLMSIKGRILHAQALFYAGVADTHAGLKKRQEVARIKQNSAVLDLIELMNRYMALPASGKVDVADRRRLIREAGKAAGGSNVVDLWRDAEKRWLKRLEGLTSS